MPSVFADELDDAPVVSGTPLECVRALMLDLGDDEIAALKSSPARKLREDRQAHRHWELEAGRAARGLPPLRAFRDPDEEAEAAYAGEVWDLDDVIVLGPSRPEDDEPWAESADGTAS